MIRPPLSRWVSLLLVWLVALDWLTEAVGWLFCWPAGFGGWPLGQGALYWPGQFLTWFPLLSPEDHWILWTAAGLCLLLPVAFLIHLALNGGNRSAPADGVGAERWADAVDLRRAGLLRRRRP